MVGGSLGARTINRSIQGDLDKFFASDVQVIWQTGRYYYSDASKHLKAYRGMPVWCSDFITRMDYAYSAADLVISRAGASSISELCLLGKTGGLGAFAECGGRSSDQECLGLGP